MAHSASASNRILTPNKYQPNLLLAGIAGLVGQLMWLGFYYPVYAMYQEDSLDLFRLFGSFIYIFMGNHDGNYDPGIARLVGIPVVLGLGVVIGLIYAWILYILNLQSTGAMGFIFGGLVFTPMIAFVIPWTVGFLAQLTGIQMNVPDVAFNQAGHGNAGWDGPVYVLVAYLIYGVILGAMYRHKLRDLTKYEVKYQGG